MLPCVRLLVVAAVVVVVVAVVDVVDVACKNRGKNIYWLWARSSRPTVRRDPCIGSQSRQFVPFLDA